MFTTTSYIVLQLYYVWFQIVARLYVYNYFLYNILCLTPDSFEVVCYFLYCYNCIMTDARELWGCMLLPILLQLYYDWCQRIVRLYVTSSIVTIVLWLMSENCEVVCYFLYCYNCIMTDARELWGCMLLPILLQLYYDWCQRIVRLYVTSSIVTIVLWLMSENSEVVCYFLYWGCIFTTTSYIVTNILFLVPDSCETVYLQLSYSVILHFSLSEDICYFRRNHFKILSTILPVFINKSSTTISLTLQNGIPRYVHLFPQIPVVSNQFLFLWNEFQWRIYVVRQTW